MARNQKLTPLLAGRTIQSASQSDNVLTVTFTDGSTMKIKTGAPGPAGSLPGHTVKAVRQTGTVMNLDLDGSTATIRLAEATSSVMLRDAKGVMEYAD